VFFREVCGRYRDCQFLHYNLMRTKRLITPEQYAELAAEHPNLVATKNSTDSMLRLEGLLRLSPDVQHFVSETGYVHASQIGPCGLLASVATNHAACRAFFEAVNGTTCRRCWNYIPKSPNSSTRSPVRWGRTVTSIGVRQDAVEAPGRPVSTAALAALPGSH